MVFQIVRSMRPGERKLALKLTRPPTTCEKLDEAIASLRTPFWRQTIGIADPVHSFNWESADGLSWVLTVSRIQSSGDGSNSSSSLTARTDIRNSLSGLRIISPDLVISSA